MSEIKKLVPEDYEPETVNDTDEHGNYPGEAKDRLGYLRKQIREECISYEEVAELQSLKDYIEPDDVELLEWAGVPETSSDRLVDAVEVEKSDRQWQLSKYSDQELKDELVKRELERKPFQMGRRCEVCNKTAKRNSVVCSEKCQRVRLHLHNMINEYFPTHGCSNCWGDLGTGCTEQCKKETSQAYRFSRDLWYLIAIIYQREENNGRL